MPGYVDEFVCETDRHDVPIYHIQDANFNVVGLVNHSGAMLRQYTLDPYGRVIRSDQFLTHAPSRIGHQGLFFDRLDAGVTSGGFLPEHMGVTSGGPGDTPTPWPGHYQNRNRTYAPQHRRWMQGDPNGTGMPLLDSMVYLGQVAMPNLSPASASALFIDGANRHIAHGGSPLASTDPTGLFFGFSNLMVNGIAAGIEEGIGGYTGWAGQRAGGALGSMLDEYSVNLLFDVEWALDWSMGDDWGSRVGVAPGAYYGGAAVAAGGFDGDASWALAGRMEGRDEWGTITRPKVHGGIYHDAKSRAWAEYLYANGFEEIHFNRVTGAQADVVAKRIGSDEYMAVEVANTSVYTEDEMEARKARLATYLKVPASQIEYVQHDVSVSPTLRGTRFNSGGRRGGR